MTQLIQQPKQGQRKGRSLRQVLRYAVVRFVLLVVVGAIGVMATAGVWAAVRQSRRETCFHNLSQLGLAFHAYHEKHEHFPAAAITGKDGKPLLSWRVELLPYMGRQDLYDEFHRDEPWDGPHNLALLSKMPEMYACPSEPDRARGLTTYQVVVGPKAGLGVVGTMFEEARGIDIREVTDGASNTVLVAETGRPMPWTQPDDRRFVEGGALPTFGSRHNGGFNALFADSSVRFLRFTLSLETLRLLLTRDGNEILNA